MSTRHASSLQGGGDRARDGTEREPRSVDAGYLDDLNPCHEGFEAEVEGDEWRKWAIRSRRECQMRDFARREGRVDLEAQYHECLKERVVELLMMLKHDPLFRRWMKRLQDEKLRDDIVLQLYNGVLEYFPEFIAPDAKVIVKFRWLCFLVANFHPDDRAMDALRRGWLTP